MNELIAFVSEHGMAILILLSCVIVFALRFIKTGRSYDILRWILKIIDMIVPDKKKGGGKFVNKSSHVD